MPAEMTSAAQGAAVQIEDRRSRRRATGQARAAWPSFAKEISRSSPRSCPPQGALGEREAGHRRHPRGEAEGRGRKTRQADADERATRPGRRDQVRRPTGPFEGARRRRTRRSRADRSRTRCQGGGRRRGRGVRRLHSGPASQSNCWRRDAEARAPGRAAEPARGRPG